MNVEARRPVPGPVVARLREHARTSRTDRSACRNLTAADLASALKEVAGIKWRVIVISACHAGSFIDELRNVDHDRADGRGSRTRRRSVCSDRSRPDVLGRSVLSRRAAALESRCARPSILPRRTSGLARSVRTSARRIHRLFSAIEIETYLATQSVVVRCYESRLPVGSRPARSSFTIRGTSSETITRSLLWAPSTFIAYFVQTP
jgi:hypothetical protein